MPFLVSRRSDQCDTTSTEHSLDDGGGLIDVIEAGDDSRRLTSTDLILCSQAVRWVFFVGYLNRYASKVLEE